LAAWLRPDPLGQLERSPDLLAAIGVRVLLSLLLRGREGRGGEGREQREGIIPPLYLTSGYGPAPSRGRVFFEFVTSRGG